jgi:molecular chaperone DnaK (HSP70)
MVGTFSVAISIDFGTTYSGYAYCFVAHTKRGDIYKNTDWSLLVGQKSPYVKTPTYLLYEGNKFDSWGYKAKKRLVELRQQGSASNYHFIEKFKTELFHRHKVDENGEPYLEDDGEKFLIIDLVADYLREISSIALQDIKNHAGSTIDETQIRWCLTVPAIWNDAAKQLMEQAAKKAGILKEGDWDAERFMFALEPEAAAVYCLYVADKELGIVENRATMMIADCGGGTVDLTVHEIIRDGREKGLREVVPGSGAAEGHGGKDVDKNFLNYFAKVLSSGAIDMFESQYPEAYLQMMDDWETFKYGFDPDDYERGNFRLPSELRDILQKHYPKVLEELANKQNGNSFNVSLTRKVMENEIFGPVVNNILERIKEVFNRIGGKCDYLYLVGGFATSRFLQQRVKEKFSSHVKKKVFIPAVPGQTILMGAVLLAHTGTNVEPNKRLSQQSEELTICFIGKTGAGKSTLINACYNWCLGVDGKENTERKYCISTRSQEGNPLQADKQFAHLNTEDQKRKKGASSTIAPSKYTFKTDKFILHIIDTPGFADTTGVETDRDHIKQILEQITQLNQVHIFGIVWNEKRLTTEQKFVVGCLKELLPKERYKNLVVCVTNTLEVDADTKDAISAVGLEQCPVICFDNLWVTAENWGRVSLMFRGEADVSFKELIECAKAAEPVSSEIFQSIVRKRTQLNKNRNQIYAQIATLNNHKQALKKVIRELDDLSKDISHIKVTRTKISAKETPAQWNTFCKVCGSNCHINCYLSFKTTDLSGCAAMDSRGNCTKCGHRHTVHTHECTKMEREEIREEITDNENLRKKQGKEQEQSKRRELQKEINKKISSLDSEIEEQLKGLRLVVDELSALVMAPFNPHYLDYLDTLNEVAKQDGDVEIAQKLEAEINDYKTFIDLLKSGVKKIMGFVSNN